MKAVYEVEVKSVEAATQLDTTLDDFKLIWVEDNQGEVVVGSIPSPIKVKD